METPVKIAFSDCSHCDTSDGEQWLDDVRALLECLRVIEENANNEMESEE